MEIGKTMSVCPVCLAKIPAKKMVGDDGNIYMEKRCWDHGNFRTLIWEGDIESYIAWAEGDANGIVSMQKRVGIARAIALNPEYLFCDEPNSGLDPYTSILIDRLISDLTKEFNMTTVVNTHDMNSILEIGDKIGFISQGSLLWQGDRHTILKTECKELRDFVCANTLARNIIEGR